jgi:hypothetical protein
MQLSVVMASEMRENSNEKGEKPSQSPRIWTKYIRATVKNGKDGDRHDRPNNRRGKLSVRSDDMEREREREMRNCSIWLKAIRSRAGR